MKPLAAPARIIPLHTDRRVRQHRVRAESEESFWPALSSDYALQSPALANPGNRPARVLSEIALIFGAVGVAVLAVWLFLPASP